MSDDRLLLILRRLDEIKAQARPHSGLATDPHSHRLFGTPGQSSKEGLRPVLSSVDANLLAGPRSGRHYLLTDPRQFGILQSGPGWRGIECNSTN
jgi:hypothetical protein